MHEHTQIHTETHGLLTLSTSIIRSFVLVLEEVSQRTEEEKERNPVQRSKQAKAGNEALRPPGPGMKT